MARRVKVLLFDYFDYPSAGHHLEYVGGIARYLREAGDAVTFVTWRRPPSAMIHALEEPFVDVCYLEDDVKPPRFGGWMAMQWLGVRQSIRLSTREGLDVVHFVCLDRNELALLATLAGRRRVRPAVFATLIKPWFIPLVGEDVRADRRLFRLLSRKALMWMLSRGAISGLFVHSHATKEALLAGVSNRRLSSRILVVPDPAKEPRAMSKAEARRSLSLPPETQVLLFFGETRSDKGPDLFLEALIDLEGDWAAVVAGVPAVVGEREAREVRARLADPDRLVTRFGYIPEADADRYFRAADVVVLPYRSSTRGTSGVLRRAAASGKPVVATDVGEVGPEVRRWGLGVVVPPDSSEQLTLGLRELLAAEDEILKRFEAAASAYSDEHGWRNLGAATREAYLSASAGRP